MRARFAADASALSRNGGNIVDDIDDAAEKNLPRSACARVEPRPAAGSV